MVATSEQQNDLLSEHLPYEVQMLNFAYNSLCAGPPSQAHINVLLEAFCLHARNLIDFFTEQSLTPKNYAGAKHYVSAYLAFGGMAIKRDRLYAKINEQIAHLTYKREKKLENKIQGSDMARLKQILDTEIKNFIDSLPSPHRSTWDTGAAQVGLSP
jgi:hypothetical protein